MLSFQHLLFQYWLYSSGFITIFVLFNALLDCVIAFRRIFFSWEDCLVITGSGKDLGPIARTMLVAVLAFVFLRMQRVDSYLVEPLIPVSESSSGYSIGVNSGTSDNTDNGTAGETNESEDTGTELITPRNAGIRHILGEGGYAAARRRVLQRLGRYPPLASFPFLDAFTLRPYHRFSDPSLFDNNLLSLVRSINATLGRNRTVGNAAFFAEVDRLLEDMESTDSRNPLPISLQHHPRLIHSHPYMLHRTSFPEMSEVVFQFQEVVRVSWPILNPLHRELRFLTSSLMYLIGRLEQAAASGDVFVCIETLDLMDNVTTSLRGLCEVEYSVREQASRTHQ